MCFLKSEHKSGKCVIRQVAGTGTFCDRWPKSVAASRRLAVLRCNFLNALGSTASLFTWATLWQQLSVNAPHDLKRRLLRYSDTRFASVSAKASEIQLESGLKWMSRLYTNAWSFAPFLTRQGSRSPVSLRSPLPSKFLRCLFTFDLNDSMTSSAFESRVGLSRIRVAHSPL